MSISDNSMDIGHTLRPSVFSRAFDLLRGAVGVGAHDEGMARPAILDDDYDMTELTGHEVYVLGDRSRSLLSAAAILEGTARSVTLDDNVRRGLNRAGREKLAPTVCLVDIDEMQSVDEAVDVLTAFRRMHPGVAIVIASRDFKRNDYSHERFVIADASLRLPAGRANVALALRASVENNARQLHVS
ncbi:MAG: hypothetical protein GC186_16595 [Rhodobacteraceae bacterium]|nr:hypothetical protein [Paracoccaceae bacterium]